MVIRARDGPFDIVLCTIRRAGADLPVGGAPSPVSMALKLRRLPIVIRHGGAVGRSPSRGARGRDHFQVIGAVFSMATIPAEEPAPFAGAKVTE